jgi:hypothetical protein
LGRIGLRALTALLPLLAAAANGAWATQPFPAEAAPVCTTSEEALRRGPDGPAPAPPLFLTPSGPATELAAKEARRDGPSVTRCPRSPRHASIAGTAAARARAARLAYLDFRESLARAWLGSFFGSTAPPPLPG